MKPNRSHLAFSVVCLVAPVVSISAADGTFDLLIFAGITLDKDGVSRAYKEIRMRLVHCRLYKS